MKNVFRRFTLIELLVVVSIIAVLASMLLPALSAARSSAEQTKCVSTIRQAAIVMNQYFGDNNDMYIPLTTWGYGYSDWYPSVRDYLTLTGKNQTGTFQKDQPVELSCPSVVSGINAYGYNHFSYAINFRVRYIKGYYGATLWATNKASYRMNDFESLDRQGLLVDNSSTASTIYYMSIKTAVVGYSPTGPYSHSTPMHQGKGVGLAYVDGHAQFSKVNPNEIAANVYNRSLPWVSGTCWGKLTTGGYVASHYLTP